MSEFSCEALKMAECTVVDAESLCSVIMNLNFNWRSKQQNQATASKRESEQTAKIARLKRRLAERDE